jgi:hypothetical protein
MFRRRKQRQANPDAPPPPRYVLLAVHGAQATQDGRVDYDIEARTPKRDRMRMPYTYDPTDAHPLTLALTEWRAAHPNHAIAPADSVTVEQVKQEAARRIRALIPRWKMERALSGGKAIPAADQKAAQAVRNASDRIEKMNPIPADYTNDRYWR